MIPFLVAAGLTAAATYAQGISAKNSAIRSANSASRAEGEQIREERINTMVANSYQAAFGQLQLALQKRQAAGAQADVREYSLIANSEQDAVNAAGDTIGASVQAVSSDIAQRLADAEATIEANLEQEIVNYNMSLDNIVLNTKANSPTVRKNEYIGPSNGQILFSAIVSTAADFAGSYATRRANLGVGKGS